MELNGFPLYASANSEAWSGSKNFMTTIERLGTESLLTGQYTRRSTLDWYSPDDPQMGYTFSSWSYESQKVGGSHPCGDCEDT
jgi:hypothetical protein